MNRLHQFLIAIDQVINTLFGSGWADETLSAYYWRTHKELNIKIVDAIFGKDHCFEAYGTERKRMHSPPEERV